MFIVRSESYKEMVNTYDDEKVRLINKKTREEYYPIYRNIYGKMYFITEDDDIVFIREDRINNYEIVEV